jgi:hypothetical protein
MKVTGSSGGADGTGLQEEMVEGAEGAVGCINDSRGLAARLPPGRAGSCVRA